MSNSIPLMGQKGGKFWWLFTVNNYAEDDAEKIMSSDYFDKYVFQEEVGKKCGTPHLQCAVKFAKPVIDGLMWLRRLNIKNIANVKFAGADWRKRVNYCCKEDTLAGKRYIKGWKVPKPLKLIVPDFAWEQQILEMIKDEPDDRTIHWCFDRIGNQGKTQFAKYLCVRHGALFISGKSADMKYAVVEHMKKNNGNGPEIVVINVPKSHMDYISYEGIESVKDGIFFSGKYESTMCVFNSPWIFVFANELPDFEKMSMDRWKVAEILDENKEVVWCGNAC